LADTSVADSGMDYEYISWSHFYRLCGRLYHRVSGSGFEPQLIVAIARGGYPVARVLADFFGSMNLISLKIEHYHGPDKLARATIPYPRPLPVDGRRVLLVDDVSDSGDTFAAAFEHLAQHGSPSELRTAVLHHKTLSSQVPDYYAQRIVKWRWVTYPWAVVEDLTVIAGRMQPVPAVEAELIARLKTETNLRLPQGVLAEVAPIVLERLTGSRQVHPRET
jgi:hypothetical protein